MSYIVMVGNPSEGYKYYGPYPTFDDACDSHEGDAPWSWVAEMLPPEKKP
jgi:hypothetical protein